MGMTIALVVVVLLAALLAYAATRSPRMHVERSITINALPEKIFPFVNDFHNWTVWSPWERLDPALKRSYGGSHSGKGAVYEWDGNKKVGAGRMEILDALAPTLVTIKLDFLRPFEGHNITGFQIIPRGQSTAVTWTMDGASPFMARLMGIFVNMDKLIGKDFETGLSNLKASAEH
ncbi:MAG TPA: SRPBCC family protein [Vicinamibacterales bacterium]|jgi:hypothetical protein|nr:SRPBCC family protein [Vicinamibacterales bacterium]